MARPRPFVPNGPTVNHAVTGSSTAALRIRDSGHTGCARNVRVYNSSATVIVFITTGGSAVVAADAGADMPVPPGQVEIFTLSGDYVRAIGSAAGPTTVYYTPGEGI